jgi:hypothetical protein
VQKPPSVHPTLPYPCNWHPQTPTKSEAEATTEKLGLEAGLLKVGDVWSSLQCSTLDVGDNRLFDLSTPVYDLPVADSLHFNAMDFCCLL